MTLAKTERYVRKEPAENGLEGALPMRTFSENSHLPPQSDPNFVQRAFSEPNEELLQQMNPVGDNVRQQTPWSQRILNKIIIAVIPEMRRKFNENRQANNGDSVDGYQWGQGPVEEYNVAYDCHPPPVFIALLSLFLIGVFIYSVKMNSDMEVTWFEGVDRDSVLIWNPKRRIELWRYISYMFLHSGYTHLLFNVLLQLTLGTLLELVHKFHRVGFVYMLGVLAGSLAHSIFDAKSYLAGASGGCYALLGGHFATVLINWNDMQQKWNSSAINVLSSGVMRLFFILLMAGADFYVSVYSRYLMTSTNESQIGVSAHAGGFIAGILVGVPILRNFDIKRWEQVLFWVCLFLFCLFLIISVLFNYFCDSYGVCDPLSLPPK